jgi:hypothetical protein
MRKVVLLLAAAALVGLFGTTTIAGTVVFDHDPSGLKANGFQTETA